MRRYSRFKVCKTNFYFFFYSSRLAKFKRPKWNPLKIKLNFIKKSAKKKFYFLNFRTPHLYNIPLLFKTLKYNYKFISIQRAKLTTKELNSQRLSFVARDTEYTINSSKFDFSF